MPVTYPQLPASSPFGWGTQLAVSSDFVGPLPSGTEFQLSISLDSEATQRIGFLRFPTSAPQATLPVLLSSSEPTALPSRAQVEGQTVFITTELRDVTSGAVLDSGTQQQTWTGTNASVVTQQLAGQGGGGLTQEEHGWLEQVLQFVQNTLTFGGTIATQLGAGGLIDHPDLNLLSLCDEELVLSGTGSINRPRPGVGVEAYGLSLSVSVSPPGAGLLDGVVREFSVRVIQLVTVHKSASQPFVYPVEIFDSRAENETWIWKAPFPDSISYHVTPGFIVLARWLCLPQF